MSFAANGHLIGQVLNSDVHEPLNQWHWPAFPLEPLGDVLNLKGDLFSNEVFKGAQMSDRERWFVGLRQSYR